MLKELNKILKKVLVGFLMIVLTNVIIDNIISYSIVNIAIASVFGVPGVIMLVIMSIALRR